MGGFGEQFLVDVSMNPINADPWSRSVNADLWERDVDDLLLKIAACRTGMALLQEIRRAGKRILIIPPEPGPMVCNSRTIGHVGNLALKHRNRTYFAFVEMDPRHYFPGSWCYRVTRGADPAHNRASLPDEILFHELVHAHRRAAGIAPLGPRGGGLNLYGNGEEFLAVVITNVYISDGTNHRKSGLRADHSGHRPLESNLNTSLTFYKSSPQALTLIKEFAEHKDEKPFFDDLTKVNARFNPFAALRECEPYVTRLAHSGAALKREVAGWIATGATDVSAALSAAAGATGLIRPAGQPPPLPPTAGQLAKSVLDPLAEEALRVLRR
jgi:hypothetical protein